jgi:hypothetical protein
MVLNAVLGAEATQFYVSLPVELRPRAHRKPLVTPPLETYVRSKLVPSQAKRAEQTLVSKVDAKYLLLHNPKSQHTEKTEVQKHRLRIKKEQRMLSSKQRKQLQVHQLPPQAAVYASSLLVRFYFH